MFASAGLVVASMVLIRRTNGSGNLSVLRCSQVLLAINIVGVILIILGMPGMPLN